MKKVNNNNNTAAAPKTLSSINDLFLGYTATAKQIKVNRKMGVADIISILKDEANDLKILTSKSQRKAKQETIEAYLGDKKIDNFTKRGIKLAAANILYGYNIKFRLISIAQAENLVKYFKKETVNELMKHSDTIYAEEITKFLKKNSIAEMKKGRKIIGDK